jgi:C-terminal processing protease CtpA/Prc
MKNLLSCLFLFATINSIGQGTSSKQYKEDFNYFCNTIETDYAYWNKIQTNWEKVKTYYSPYFDSVSSRNSFVLLLEKVFYELYDHHASLNTNTLQSQRLVPSGTDIWAEYVNGKPIIIELRKDFGAEKAGIKPGMEILAVNNVPVAEAIKAFYPKTLKKEDVEAKNYALRVLLAGNHATKRKIRTRYGNEEKDFFPDADNNLLEHYPYEAQVDSKILEDGIGYIRINNCLGDNGLIPLFDSVMRTMAATKALILDLRETPSGGNTTVIRSIMGHFISSEGFYQKHELPAEEKQFGVKRSWEEIVSPQNQTYTKRLVVLCDHWTGSVSEGLTIGLDGLKRATIIGTRMAGLKGAVYSYTLPNTGIGFSFPVESLFHVNGTPRENFVPSVLVDLAKKKVNEDLILEEAVKYLRKK